MSAPQYAALLAVQDLDTARDRVRHRRSHHPARTELAACDAADAAAAPRRVAAEARRDEAAGRQAQLEADLAATENRSTEVSKRLYGGEVSASRELQAMAADIEALKRRASDLEDAVLAVLEEREPLDAAVAELDAASAEVASRRAAAQQVLAVAEQELDAELAGLDQQRVAAAEVVPADLLATYDRIRVHLGGIGAAPLVGNHCGGCHLVLPSTELDRVKHAAPDALLTCEQCGRILVRP
jgi:predicted  nucleic acid-binding Zn-ribbon protein